MASNDTYLVLIKLPEVRADAALGQRLIEAIEAVTPQHDGSVRVLCAVDQSLTYLYLQRTTRPDAACLADCLQATSAAAATPGTVDLLRLQNDLPGASAGAAAPWHYIVETDVEPRAEADLNAWYDTEHLPGLASVPGTVRAQRYMNEQASPRYHACYDLQTQQTFGSPPWLAVRATAWSARVRPNFRNTLRTMFSVVATVHKDKETT